MLAMVFLFLLVLCIVQDAMSWHSLYSRSAVMQRRSIIGFGSKSHAKLTSAKPSKQCLMASESSEPREATTSGFDPGAWLNPNTRGGVIVWSFLLTLIPIGFYNFFVAQGMEDTTVGAYVGAIFVLLSNLLWASTYIFRVANKDMTYAKQLRDYENAVLQKRLDELADDEINALMEEIEMDDKRAKETTANDS